MSEESVSAPKARGTLKHLHVCLMLFLINLAFESFYWRRRRHPMPDLDRLVLISTMIKLMDSGRTTLPGQAFDCASRSMNNSVIRTQSNSKRIVSVSIEAKESIYLLCSLKDIRDHNYVVATVPDPPPDPQAVKDLVYDLTIVRDIVGPIARGSGQQVKLFQ